MKRYLMFAGDTYYAQGGWRDFVKDFDTLEAAIEHGERKIYGEVPGDPEDTCEWFHIVDTETQQRVYGEGFCHGS